MSEKKENKKLSANLIAAIVAIIMGFILAVGYPTGGVRAKDDYKPAAVQKAPAHKRAIKIDTPKTKKRVVKELPRPAPEENEEDEGC